MDRMDKTMTSDNGPVLTCKVEDCAYNHDDCCWAAQIEVGDEHPYCDTYTREAASATSQMSIVSTCHVADCHFNQSETCHAAGITVGFHSGHADCMTARIDH